MGKGGTGADARERPSDFSPVVTLVVVSYNTPSLNLSWVPLNVQVLIVHNDLSLDAASVQHPGAKHLFTGENVGFGAGVNRALPSVLGRRIVLANPDIELTEEHWGVLVEGDADEVITVPIIQPDRTPTSIVNRYPTPASHLLTSYRLGRFAPLGSRRRSVAARALGLWGRAHRRGLGVTEGSWPLVSFWVSGAVLSVDTERLRSVGGFDEDYFLYFEDIDLCARLAAKHPMMRVVMRATVPAVHHVGASAANTRDAPHVAAQRRASAKRWAASRDGLAWRLVNALVRPLAS